MAEHPKFSHTANWLGLPSLCPVLSSNHVWELAVLLELVPPVSPSSPPYSPPPSLPPPPPHRFIKVLLGLWVVRLSSTPAPWLWLIVVCHANISVLKSESMPADNWIQVWAWLLYFISVHSCPQPTVPLSGNVFSTGLVRKLNHNTIKQNLTLSGNVFSTGFVETLMISLIVMITKTTMKTMTTFAFYCHDP